MNTEREIFFHIHRCSFYLSEKKYSGKGALHIALGIDLVGKNEILGFWINKTESSSSWKLIINYLNESE